MNIGLVIAVISVLGAAVAGCELEESGDEGGGGNDRPKPEGLNDTQSNPALNEGETDEYNYLPGNDTGATVTYVLVRLNWSDEDPFLPLWTNDPDTFNLSVIAPDGQTHSEEAANGADGNGEIVIDLSGEWRDSWKISVTMVEAGNQMSPIPGISLADNGNGYQVDVFFKYWPAQ